jgi:hypothetical protein
MVKDAASQKRCSDRPEGFGRFPFLYNFFA